MPRRNSDSLWRIRKIIGSERGVPRDGRAPDGLGAPGPRTRAAIAGKGPSLGEHRDETHHP
eukprot:3230942-Pyramimonas_sp.AAC.1